MPGGSHGYRTARHPEQWQRVLDDESLVDSAVEEIIRWAAPVIHKRCTAAVDTEIARAEISTGDKVVMWYSSANRHESILDKAATFDLGRDPNAYVAFGGGGPHFCLGAFRVEEVFGGSLIGVHLGPIAISGR